ncbi:hypothetical protein [Loktanella sp. 3ANDIMAR09]|uniref:hypothetical protein n=1 Tax=Loktanella sp. 3ANDIMAR09 TaxID=1225657 RepID=UPI0006F4F5B9|nr:hypothetical protein [Loktanella sp. 3ANDIMAR09]
MPTKILALDLATTTGWAICTPGVSMRSGSVRFAGPKEDQAMAFARYSEWLDDIFRENEITAVVYEQPMDPRHMKNPKTGRATTNFDTIRLLLGLCAVTEARSRICGIPRIFEAPVQSVRKHLLKGRPPKGEAKIAVARMLSILGYRPTDDNEADAIAIALFASAILEPGKDIATPLPLGRG